MAKHDDKKKDLGPPGDEISSGPEENAAQQGDSSKEVNPSGDVQTTAPQMVKETNETEAPAELPFDSTSVMDIQILVDENEGALLRDFKIRQEVQAFEETVLKDETKTTEEKLAAAADLTNRFARQYNIATHAQDSILTRYAIDLGTMCNYAKFLVRQAGEPWEEWAPKRINLKERSRQKYMRLAARRDCHEYTFLGLERLDHLVSVTEGMTSEDPIGDLLSEFKIPVRPDEETNLEAFKNLVDAALAVIRCRKYKVAINFETATGLIALGGKFDQKMIKTLVGISKSKGDPNLYLKRLQANQGKEEVLEDEDKELERVHEGVRKVSNSLEALRKKFPKMPELVRKLNISLLQRLQGQLMSLTTPPTK